jgi:hypothetical protein
MLFAEGNHNCPSCEKSGRCTLQAVAVRGRHAGLAVPVSVPRAGLGPCVGHHLAGTGSVHLLPAVRGVHPGPGNGQEDLQHQRARRRRAHRDRRRTRQQDAAPNRFAKLSTSAPSAPRPLSSAPSRVE